MQQHRELLDREDRAWLAFVDAFSLVPDARREDEGVVPGWSVKDLVWHCGYWTGYVADLVERAARGDGPAPDQDWDGVNALVVEEGRGMTWDEIIVRSEANRARFRAALPGVTELSDDLLEDIAGETYDHYDEHAAEIRAFAVA
jgi:hypothetical protein